MYVLGLESSCDDTCAAVLHFDGAQASVLSNEVYSQNDLHADFGGVVPEIAARAHAERIDPVTKTALKTAGITLADIDLIATTAGPGLIGGVMAGVMYAKGLSASLGTPLIGVNHLAGHALTPALTDGLAFPYLMLLVSGGHCQILIAHGPETFERLGGTIDDAPGEAFDKVARLLGLAQPGGPSIERQAKLGDPLAMKLPRPLLDRDDMNMSFSGLKTAVARLIEAQTNTQNEITLAAINDISAAFQLAVADILTEKTRRAFRPYLTLNPAKPAIAVAGGVAANQSIRTALANAAAEAGLAFSAPPLKLCTDNAAMIAFAGGLQFQQGRQDDLSLSARPRWPLDQSQAAMLGSGKKGPKA